MKKRGPIIGLVGVSLFAASFLAVLAIYPTADPTMGGEIFLPNFLEDMFDEVTQEIQIFPGQTHTFSYTVSQADVPLLWGLQILDYQNGDSFSVVISNVYGEELSSINQSGPIIFDVFLIPKIDTYYFEVTNTGDRPIMVSMMFSEDPDNSEALSDPNSPFLKTIMPLAISGIILLIGIIIMAVGGIITIIDWKNEKKSPKYY